MATVRRALKHLRHPVLEHRRARLLPDWVRRTDARAADRINRQQAHGALDTFYRRLSRAADRGRLWIAIALILFVFGRGRAAIRGTASLTAASILANLVGKRLFGGPRPLLSGVPVGRQLAKYPTSASFPSGHSASAAAFATGLALESPAAGAVVAPLAAAVAYSRLHVSAHWLSDVVGGVALGAGVAGLGALLVPARVPTDQPIPGGGAPATVPALGDGDGLLILANPGAGTAVLRPDPRIAIRRRLPEARLHELRDGETFAGVVSDALASATPPRVLGVLGGDGSVSSAAHEARGADLPLLVLPGGTFNHFARAAGVPDVGTALDAARSGTGVGVGAAELRRGDRVCTVLNSASVGIYPDFVAERDKRRKALGKWLAAVVAAVRVLRDAQPLEVEVDGERARVWSVFLSVGRNEPGQISTMQRRSLDDDVLDVRVLHARGSRLRAVLALSFGRKTSRALRAARLLPSRSDLDEFTTPELRLTVHSRDGRAVDYAHDGELEDTSDLAPEPYTLEVTMHPDALVIYTPIADAAAEQ